MADRNSHGFYPLLSVTGSLDTNRCSECRIWWRILTRLKTCTLSSAADLLPGGNNKSKEVRQDKILKRATVPPGGLLGRHQESAAFAMRVICGLRFPRRSTAIRPARSSLRRALAFASRSTPQSCSMRLETIKVSCFRRPRICQGARPTNKDLTPSWLALHVHETGIGPAINRPFKGRTLRP
jgi:hypothetical protein